MNKKGFLTVELDDAKGYQLLERVYLEQLKDRKIVLNAEIDDSVYDLVAMQIKKFNKEDEGKPVEDRTPIELHVNSVGGSVYDGFGLCSVMLASETPIHTHVDGYVMSMGFIIYICGNRRFCGKLSNFMYHEISTQSYGKNTEIEEVTKENRRLQKMYDDVICERTKLKQTQLNKVKKAKKDWFFGAEDAVKFGVAHEIK